MPNQQQPVLERVADSQDLVSGEYQIPNKINQEKILTFSGEWIFHSCEQPASLTPSSSKKIERFNKEIVGRGPFLTNLVLTTR